jgi:hypothetical protein
VTQRHLPAGRINPVTYAPMPAETKTVYRVGFYDASGHLVKHQEGWPEMDNPTLQMIADISAASHQPSMGAGTTVVWEDVDAEPPGHLSALFGDDWTWCHFGPDQPPVPEYRYEVDPENRTILTFRKESA